MAPIGTRDLVDEIHDVVLAVPGVAGLHAGVFGEAATYLPGRRVGGIRRTPAGLELHLSLRLGAPLRATADAVRAAVAPLTGTPVHITIEDVVSP